MADQIVKLGFKEVGYEYVNIDVSDILHTHTHNTHANYKQVNLLFIRIAGQLNKEIFMVDYRLTPIGFLMVSSILLTM